MISELALNKMKEFRLRSRQPVDLVQRLGRAKSKYQFVLNGSLLASKLGSFLASAEDPGFLRCEPWGLARQLFAPHQIEIRQRGNDRIELRYGEWDARRTIYLDGRKRPDNQAPSLLGHSLGRWDGDTLVVETSGIAANIASWSALIEHSDQLRVVERYTRSQDGKTLLLTATMEKICGILRSVG